MKTQQNILIAFLLNLGFAVFEFFGGIFTGSIAIVSDALHDLGDAVSIGISYFLEKISKRQPDSTHTYGYGRFSVLGSLLTTSILLVGSVVVVYNAINRLFFPVPVNYDGMIVFAVIGLCVNLIAAFVTREGDSLNQKAINLHMLEDVLGWAVVLIGAIIMRFTNLWFIDPVLSIVVAVFLFVHAFGNLKETVSVFLEMTPINMDIEEIRHHLKEIPHILDVHHIHVWSMDGQNSYATMHIKHNGNAQEIKHLVREELAEHGIVHATLELETEEEDCHEENCHVRHAEGGHHHHHHHHHH